MPEPATLLAFADASMVGLGLRPATPPPRPGVGEEADAPSITAIAEAGGAFDWLADEPDLYSDADLVRPPPWRAG